VRCPALDSPFFRATICLPPMPRDLRPPPFFRDACKVASARKDNYSHPGREIMRRLGELCPDDLELESWDAKCNDLYQACERNDRASIVRWFGTNLPGCINLVQTRARPKFVDGVLEGWADRQNARQSSGRVTCHLKETV
jgi:hypothetical protein